MDEKKELMKLMRSFENTLRGDARAQERVKALNTLLNSGHNLKLLDDDELKNIWELIFFALWYAEMGRGCEEIIAAVERACSTNYSLTRVGFKTIAQKWYGLDQYRVDKVSHLARHLLSVLINQQIRVWFRSLHKRKGLGSRDISCKRLLKETFLDIYQSYGLCYFILEILADEIVRSSSMCYSKLGLTVGKFELKANLIVFLYKQVISFSAGVKLDARLLRTFDQYVVKKFIEEILPNEAQLTQILISLRLYQSLQEYEKKAQTGKCRALLHRWAKIIQDVHENCINGEYFPPTIIPQKDTIHLEPKIKIGKFKF